MGCGRGETHLIKKEKRIGLRLPLWDWERQWKRNSMQSYPTHTHASHITFGFVSDGAVCVVRGGEREIYRAGASFCIFPDTPHAIETVNGAAYSMISVCVSVSVSHDPAV